LFVTRIISKFNRQIILVMGIDFKTRKLKVVPRPGADCIDVPKINLAGKWLNDAGFAIGNPVEVKVTANCITIRRAKQPPTVTPA